MKYDNNMTKEQRRELLQKIRNGEEPHGVSYGYSECETTSYDIETVVNDRLQDLEEWNFYNKEEKYFEDKTMEIGVFVPFAFPKYFKDCYLEDILNDIADDSEDECETREHHKGIYLDRIIEILDDNLKEGWTSKNEITEPMWAAEKSLYDTLKTKVNEELRYVAEKALYDAIEKDYQVYWCEEIGKIEVKTAEYAYDEYKHLIKGAENE